MATLNKEIEAAEAIVASAENHLQECRQELDGLRKRKAWRDTGLKVGDRVWSRAGKQFSVSDIDGRYGWVRARQILKDGSIGANERTLYDDWSRCP